MQRRLRFAHWENGRQGFGVWGKGLQIQGWNTDAGRNHARPASKLRHRTTDVLDRQTTIRQVGRCMQTSMCYKDRMYACLSVCTYAGGCRPLFMNPGVCYQQQRPIHRGLLFPFSLSSSSQSVWIRVDLSVDLFVYLSIYLAVYRLIGRYTATQIDSYIDG